MSVTTPGSSIVIANGGFLGDFVTDTTEFSLRGVGLIDDGLRLMGGGTNRNMQQVIRFAAQSSTYTTIISKLVAAGFTVNPTGSFIGSSLTHAGLTFWEARG